MILCEYIDENAEKYIITEYLFYHYTFVAIKKSLIIRFDEKYELKSLIINL